MTHPLRRRPAREGSEDGFALVFSLLFILMIAVLSIGVAGLVASQVQPTQFQAKTAATLNDAEAGLQVALNEIRNATNAAGSVDVASLPCGTSGSVVTTNGVVAASAQPSSGVNAYDVTIRYYTATNGLVMLTYADNPAQVQAHAAAIPCSSLSSLAKPPAYAYLTSSGVSQAVPGLGSRQGDRNAHLVYRFGLTNSLTIGGEITATAPNQCWSTTGTLGAPIVLAGCALSVATGTVSSSAAYIAEQFQAVPAGNGSVLLLYGGNPGADLCVRSPGPGGGGALLALCNSSDRSQQFTSSSATLVDYAGNCLAGSPLGPTPCGGAGTTVTAGASVELGSAAAAGAGGNGVTECAVLTAANAAACVIGASAQSTGDLAAGSQFVSVSISVAGIGMCSYDAASGTYLPMLGTSFGASCIAAYSPSLATTAPTASVAPPAATYGAVPPSIQAPGVVFEGENTGG